MENKLMDAFPKALVFGDYFHVHGLGVIPILVESDIPVIPRLDTIDEALQKGTLTICETGEGGGEVQMISVENKGECPVIILEGEELVGAKQNRVTSTTVIVTAHSTVKIPVSCVERGRWHFTSDHFQSGKAIFRARSRAIQKSTVTERLRREGVAISSQAEVWKETDRCLREAGVRSSTDSFQDARERVAHQIEEFVLGIQPIPGQVGAVFFGRLGVIGAEYLHTPDLFARCIDKIVRSFAFEVLSSPSLNGTSPSPAQKWWGKVLDSPFSMHNSDGAGVDIRTEAKDIVCSGLQFGGTVIHLSAFPDFRLQDRPSGRRLSVKERRRNMRSTIE
jgi:hypothetical protein